MIVLLLGMFNGVILLLEDQRLGPTHIILLLLQSHQRRRLSRTFRNSWGTLTFHLIDSLGARSLVTEAKT